MKKKKDYNPPTSSSHSPKGEQAPKGNFVKRPITFLTFLGLLRQRAKEGPVVGFNPDGLEKEEIEKIQSLSEKGLLKFEELKISITMPFAPILFFGALLTYFLKGPVAF